jgi:hypothetical protein
MVEKVEHFIRITNSKQQESLYVLCETFDFLAVKKFRFAFSPGGKLIICLQKFLCVL